MKFLKTLQQNWKTGLSGAILIAGAGGATVNGQPLDPNLIMQLITGIGLLFAGDQRHADGR